MLIRLFNFVINLFRLSLIKISIIESWHFVFPSFKKFFAKFKMFEANNKSFYPKDFIIEQIN